MKKLILVYLIFASPLSFAETVATVLYSSKTVMATHNGVAHAISRGATLEAGDSIKTEAGAGANIKYKNGTLVNIGENSVYKILAYSPKSTDEQIKAELSAGKIHIKTNGKTKEALKTPVIALAILGTDVSVYVASPAKTYTQVSEGKVKVGETILGIGQSALATPQGVVSTPFPAAGKVSSPQSAPGTIRTSISVQSKTANTTTNRVSNTTTNRRVDSTTNKTSTTTTTRTSKNVATVNSQASNASTNSDNADSDLTQTSQSLDSTTAADATSSIGFIASNTVVGDVTTSVAEATSVAALIDISVLCS